MTTCSTNYAAQTRTLTEADRDRTEVDMEKNGKDKGGQIKCQTRMQ